MTKILTPWPTDFNQLNDPALDGDNVGPNGSGNNADNDCAMETASAIGMYTMGANIDADYLKDAVRGPGYVGYLTFGDLQATLANRYSIPSGLLTGNDAHLIAQHVRAWIDAGHPAAGLWYADRVNRSGGHFMPIYGYTTDSQNNLSGFYIHNVYGGYVETFTLGQFAQYLQQWDQYGNIVQSGGTMGVLSCNRQRSILP